MGALIQALRQRRGHQPQPAGGGGTRARPAGGGGYGTAARYSRGVAGADVAVGGGGAADLGDVRAGGGIPNRGLDNFLFYELDCDNNGTLR
jgi:hypothetical protein